MLFSFLLLVVLGYWLLVLLGGADTDALDGDGDDGGVLGGLGLGGVPVTVALSVLITLTWFLSLVGTVLVDSVVVRGLVVLPGAVVLGLVGTRLVVVPLRRLFPESGEASRLDFVGRVCVIRTGSVGLDFGQAEVRAADGSAAVVQVRQTGGEDLTSGSPAVIYDYDADGEFFWVSAMGEKVN
ncbi:hypothetical protein [Actinophytocola sp.]|uniref:hypothetical protein n=1 Tax=Actinophytocola sp. TaxID=1872138 RepID=UPI002D7EF8E7|nr:hypothetical protein [Actinophytocola sp.]HET9144225.1 hypothetical protein [Actinophytocola sp.]